MNNLPVVPLVAFGTLVFTFVNALKFAAAKDFNALGTQVVAWVSGVAATFLASASTAFGGGVGVAGHSLNDLDAYSKVIVGLLATSLLSTVNEIKKAIDNTDTSQTPKLFRR